HLPQTQISSARSRLIRSSTALGATSGPPPPPPPPPRPSGGAGGGGLPARGGPFFSPYFTPSPSGRPCTARRRWPRGATRSPRPPPPPPHPPGADWSGWSSSRPRRRAPFLPRFSSAHEEPRLTAPVKRRQG